MIASPKRVRATTDRGSAPIDRLAAPTARPTRATQRPSGAAERRSTASDGRSTASARPSAATERAIRFVDTRKVLAEALGRELAEHVLDPQEFAGRLAAAFDQLADPIYAEAQDRIAPGIGPVHGVRLPLQTALRRELLRAIGTDSPTTKLLLADRLLREPTMEPRWLAIAVLERVLPADPVRTWQLLRVAASAATEWITVDTLAHPFGRGILLEPYRWAELEQLTISPSRWERRLVGSTIATIPFLDRRVGRTHDVAARGLALLGVLIGDEEPDVQKALAWGYRSMAAIDPVATTEALDRESTIAQRERDGLRAWVVRDALPKLDGPDRARLAARLSGIRRLPGAAATSMAATLAARFSGIGLGRSMPEPPLT